MLKDLILGTRKQHRFSHHSRHNAFRYRLGEHDAVLPLSLLGALSGLITGVIIALFRSAIETGSILSIKQLTTQNNLVSSESFEFLGSDTAFYLPVVGAIILGAIYQFIPKGQQHTGLSHVLVRLHKHHGKLSIRQAILQFFAGVLALSTGQSGGREGPAIHLGAAANSFFAQRLNLPHNTLRILTACGAAAAIGASFNTPIAGVIFAMEVIVLEYTLVGFMPVMLAAITSTSLTQALFGNIASFDVPVMAMQSLWEIPFLLLLGLSCGLAALLFMRIQLFTQKLQRLPIMLRFAFAGLITGSIAIYLPGVLGMGYDTVNLALNSQSSWQLLIALCLGKIIATAISNGVGMPIGIIGPSLFIGATAGGALGYLAAQLQPELSSSSGFYALLGMGGVMGAILNAPLAALIAILELAHTPAAMLPSILVIVVAALCTDQIFGQRSATETVLQSQGISLASHPVAQALNRISLSAVIDTNIDLISQQVNLKQLEKIFSHEARHIVLEAAHNQHWLISRKSFLTFYAAQSEQSLSNIIQSSSLIDALNAMQLPLLKLIDMEISSTVTEARDLLRENEADGLFVYDNTGELKGILRSDALSKLIANW